MKYSFIGIILALLLVVGTTAQPAQADTDQHCLTQCVNGGGIAGKCLPQCTYNEPEAGAKTTNRSTVTSTNRVFDPPRAIGNEVVLSPHKAKPAAPDKDYNCINQCLHGGGQYDWCNKSCTKTACPSGDTHCNSLMGTAPSLPANTPSPAVH